MQKEQLFQYRRHHLKIFPCLFNLDAQRAVQVRKEALVSNNNNNKNNNRNDYNNNNVPPLSGWPACRAGGEGGSPQGPSRGSRWNAKLDILFHQSALVIVTGYKDQVKKGIMIYLNRGDKLSADPTNEQLLELKGHQGNRGSVLSQHSLR